MTNLERLAKIAKRGVEMVADGTAKAGGATNDFETLELAERMLVGSGQLKGPECLTTMVTDLAFQSGAI